MQKVYFVAHPDVNLNFNTPIESWDLSKIGLKRLDVLLQQSWLNNVGSMFSSNEQKTKTAAKKIAEKLELTVTHIQDLGEMNRSSTGPLPYDEFMGVVDEFFQKPDESIGGWEKANDAKKRIIEGVGKALDLSVPNKDVIIVSHGGVGALYFAFDKATKELIYGWQPSDKVS